MTGPAIANASRWWTGPGEPDFIAQEVVGPFGVADLVGVRYDQPALKARSEHGIEPISDLLALRVVLACRRAPRTTARLGDMLGVGGSAVRRAIRIAKHAGALDSASDQRHRIHPAWRPVARRLVAVELKRTDWKRAADQTWAYSRWAHATWMVLGKPPPLSAVRTLCDRGVGLGYLGCEGEFNVLLRPKTSRRSSAVASIWAGEQALSNAPPYSGRFRLTS